MSRNADAVITAFEKLPPAERQEVLSELLRRLALEEHDALSDDELAAAADQVFEALDREESASP